MYFTFALNNIQDNKLKQYLIKSLNELPQDFDYPNDGYFVIIENQDEIKSKPIKLSNCTLNSLDEDLYDDINMVEIKDGIIEVLVFLDSDVNVSFVMGEEILEEGVKDRLMEFII
ncbi:hypothetical protein [Poseidonibacter sp.]|uniref:hypothetical protein n=1 Tax=Poseidonibacter sp. TaxID=2321188 RepID=UPI003C717C22